MALTPEKIAEFEIKGPEQVRREVGERRHGQAPDSPIWQETMAWVEAEESRRTHEASLRAAGLAKDANDIATSALKKSSQSVRVAVLAIVLTLVLALKDLIDWFS